MERFPEINETIRLLEGLHRMEHSDYSVCERAVEDLRRMRDALHMIAGGHFDAAVNLALTENWRAFSIELQKIAAAGLGEKPHAS